MIALIVVESIFALEELVVWSWKFEVVPDIVGFRMSFILSDTAVDGWSDVPSPFLLTVIVCPLFAVAMEPSIPELIIPVALATLNPAGSVKTNLPSCGNVEEVSKSRVMVPISPAFKVENVDAVMLRLPA